jgi:hypothetical protein
MKKLLSDRSFIKKEIMFYFYGSVKSKSIHRALDLEPKLSRNQASEIIDYLRDYLDKRFHLAFELKSILTEMLKVLKKESNLCLT